MVVGGPNARSDYHYQPTEEFFYQVKGKMLLKVIEDDQFKDIEIGEGEMFMLPGQYNETRNVIIGVQRCLEVQE